VSEVDVQELPLYLAEPEARPARPLSLPGWMPAGPGPGHATRHSLVMTRIVPLVPSVAVDALLAWFRARDGCPVPYGRSHFELHPPLVHPESGQQCRMAVRLHRQIQFRGTPLELELGPWSSRLTEMDLRPLRWTVSPSESYFAAGHSFLDLLIRAMVGQAERRPTLSRRTGFGTASQDRPPPLRPWR
jgi:hypothetical protein